MNTELSKENFVEGAMIHKKDTDDIFLVGEIVQQNDSGFHCNCVLINGEQGGSHPATYMGSLYKFWNFLGVLE